MLAALRWFWGILPDLFGCSFTVAGLVVVLKPELLKVLEGEEKRIVRTFLAIALGAFGVSALISSVEQKKRAERAEETAQGTFQHSLDDLENQLKVEQLNHTGESQYLRGRLDELSQFTPAILRLAQASEENTRKQYEQKILSNKDLREFVASVVSKMRNWQYRKSQAENLAMMNQMGEEQKLFRSAINVNSPEFHQKMANLMRQETSERQQMDGKFDEEFRENILGDAVLARDQLILRLGTKTQPETLGGTLQVFNGKFYGPSPVQDAANYLEQSARKLSP